MYRKLAGQLEIVGIAATLWGLIYPRPYGLAVVIFFLLPLVGILIIARSGGLIQLDLSERNKRPVMAPVLFGPAIVLAIRAIVDYELVEWKAIFWVSLLCGTLLVFVLTRFDRQARKLTTSLFLLAVFGLPYVYGATVELNALAEQSPPVTFQVRVQNKDHTTGKYQRWNLRLAPWGPIGEIRKLSIAKKFYDEVKAGDIVCVELHQGAIGFQWYRLGQCIF